VKGNSFEDNTLDLIEQWAYDRNLINGSTPKDQICKFIQEVGELSDAICKDDLHNTVEEIGDCIVVLKILTTQLGVDLEECVEIAYNKIKDRKGVMRDGIFIKEADL
jgi:NTP pyrophosphatase (non-canonical NTP hydrolase)